MNIVTLAEVKQYLRLSEEDTDEDDMLTTFIDVAEETISKSTGITFAPEVANSRAKLACFMMVSEFYENRQMMMLENQQFSKVIQYLLIQLKYEGVDPLI